MKNKIIYVFVILLFTTLVNLSFVIKSENSKLDFLFNKIEALAEDEMWLPEVDVICSGNGYYGRCYEIRGSAHYWWCKFTGYTTDYCVKPFDYMR